VNPGIDTRIADVKDRYGSRLCKNARWVCFQGSSYYSQGPDRSMWRVLTRRFFLTQFLSAFLHSLGRTRSFGIGGSRPEAGVAWLPKNFSALDPHR
jgi:hypothetical protein